MATQPTKAERTRAAEVARLIKETYSTQMTVRPSFDDSRLDAPFQMGFILESPGLYEVILPIQRRLLTDKETLPDAIILYLAGQALIGAIEQELETQLLDESGLVVVS